MSQKNNELNIILPTDPNVLNQCIKNIYSGLNKATIKGAFDLKEAGQLCNDLNTIAQIIEQVIKIYKKDELKKD